MSTSRQVLALSEARRERGRANADRRAYEATYAEHGRRVMVCAICEATGPWRGWIAALLVGWSWDWRKGRVVFLCPEKHGVELSAGGAS